MHDALTQRPAFVRAAVFEREGAVVYGAEYRDAAAGRAHNARAAARDLIERADIRPSRLGHAPHSAAKDRSAMGANSCASLPATRSAHGSFCEKRCENTKRS